jgi:hypothetical protein
MKVGPIYEETLSSARTEALFVILTLLSLGLLFWRVSAASLDPLALALLVLALFFLYCSLNYRRLHIRLSEEALSLQFGLISWTVRLDNVAACRPDHLPAFLKYGGAGVHFMFADGRYRVSFNFLEYPRLVIALRRSAGPVRDVSFSTRFPQRLTDLLNKAATARALEHEHKDR